jgi:hypothetical protein
MSSLPDQEYLRRRIDYNPETGEARWKAVDSSYGPAWKNFNGRCAGKLLPARVSINGLIVSKARILYKLNHNVDIKRIRFVNNDSSDYSAANLVDITNVDAKIKQINVNTQKTYKSIDSRLLTLLCYDHISGNLIWNPRGDKSWDTRFSNTIAGSVGRSGYKELKIKLDSKYHSYSCHRVAWFIYYGIDPVSYQIDHIDEYRTNNSINNLRLATSSFNSQARIKDRQFSCRLKSGKFYSNIFYYGTNIYLGDFDTESEARAAYEYALSKYKSIYEFTASEQAMLDELYERYPNVDNNLQQRCHDLQVKAINAYTDAALNLIECNAVAQAAMLH